MPPLRIILIGATGKMGRALTLSIRDAPLRYQLVAAVTGRPSPQLGQDIGLLHGAPAPLGILVTEWLDPAVPADVIIDFSSSESLERLIPQIASFTPRRVPLLSGTTGLSTNAQGALQQLASVVPVLHTHNTSIGCNVLAQLVSQANAALHSLMDVHIIETHHTQKRDAPSGTALMLKQAALEGCPHHSAPIECLSIRGGDVVGEHQVQFHGMGESLILTHQARDRRIFAEGALFAAKWLATQPVHGRPYTMRDVLTLAK